MIFTNRPPWKQILDLNPLKGVRLASALIKLRGVKDLLGVLPSTSEQVKIERHQSY
jgi:hypothetical protein